MNFRRSFIILITAVCVTLNLAGIVLYNKHRQLQQSSGWVAHTYEVITEIQGFNMNVEKMIAVQRGYLLSGNSRYFTRYNDATKELDEHLKRTQALVNDNTPQKARLDSIIAHVVELKELLEIKNISKEKAAFSKNVDSVKNIADQVRELTKEMLAEEYQLLEARTIKEKSLSETYLNTLLFAAIVSITVILVGNGWMLNMLARQRRTEENLEVIQDRLQLALKGTNDGLFDWKIDSPDMYLSPRFREMLGYTDNEVASTIEGFNSLLHPDDADAAWDYTNRFLAGEIKEYRNIFRLRHKNGFWRWHLARAIMLYNEQGKPERLVGAHTDITDQKNMEERLKSSNKELEEFTYIASHDLRSPLVNLKGFTGEIDYLLKIIVPYIEKALPHVPDDKEEQIRLAITEDLPQAVGFIQTSVTRMDRLTQSILELSRLGRRELRYEKIDTEKLVDSCIQSLTHQITEKKVEISVQPLPPVQADPIALEQIFGNILDNAIKYLDPERQGKIEITARHGASDTVFHISDNGRGIADDDIKKVFEIFKRAGNNQHIPGEGMGMPYVQAMVRRMGGTIWCASRLGIGTDFYFTIPHIIHKESSI